MFYLHLLPGKTLICLHLQPFHFHFHVTGVSHHLFYIWHLMTGDSSHICRLFFHICHLLSLIFRSGSPYLRHLIFLLSKYLCCLFVASTPRLLCLQKLFIQLIFHFRNFGGRHHTSSLTLSHLTSSLSQLHPTPDNAPSASRPHVQPPSSLPIWKHCSGGCQWNIGHLMPYIMPWICSVGYGAPYMPLYAYIST